MGALIGLLAMIGAVVLWCFFTFVPKWVNERALLVFNWSAVGACVMICASWVMYMSVLLDQETLEKLRWPLAICGALLIEIGSGFGMYVAFAYWRLHDRVAPAREVAAPAIAAAPVEAATLAAIGTAAAADPEAEYGLAAAEPPPPRLRHEFQISDVRWM
jgi:hypothetical protein